VEGGGAVRSRGQWRQPRSQHGSAFEKDKPFDEYEVRGHWATNQYDAYCESIGAGLIGPGEHNTTNGFPWSWIDTSGGVTKVRVGVAGEGTLCPRFGLKFGVQTTSN
jgi:hypothetical protein